MRSTHSDVDPDTLESEPRNETTLANEVPAQPPTISFADPRDAYLDVSHFTKDLKRRTVRGGAVNLSSQIVKFAVRMGSTAILARLLTPADFGVIAMVTVVTGFVEMFKDAGLSMATIQRERISHAQVSSLFWINVGMSGVIAVAIAGTAPLLAWFYNDDRLVAITLALAGPIFISGFALQHTAVLRRRMSYVSLTAIDLAALCIGVGTAISLAAIGVDHWALVGWIYATAITTTALAWIICRWRPSIRSAASDIRPMVSFGGNVATSNLLTYIARNIDNILIGRLISAASLGLYDRAYNLFMIPVSQFFTRPLEPVALAVLSRHQSEPNQFRRFCRSLIQLICGMTFPVVVVVYTNAEEIVRIFLGSSWTGTIPIFHALALAALVSPLHNIAYWIVVSRGHGRRTLLVAVTSAVPVAVAVPLGLPYGVSGVAAAVSVAMTLSIPILALLVARWSPVQVKDQLAAIIRPAVVSACLVLTVLFTHQQLSHLGGTSLLVLSALASGAAALSSIDLRHTSLLFNRRTSKHIDK